MTQDALAGALTRSAGSIAANLQGLVGTGVINKSATGDPADPLTATYGLSMDGRRTLAVIALMLGPHRP